ncbi:hypothetical protein [Ralstonia sp.]|uniref:hypothetical protein n=1 Tax=Ralstonia sp. TaxID=54061 RepID=UPI0031DB2DD4
MLTHQLQGAFEDAYEKAAASSKPDDWMNAALLGKQFSNAYRKLSDSPACAWECASPTNARHQMAFVTTKLPTMEHYLSQGWTVTPLFRCPSPALVNVLATIERVREFDAADSLASVKDLEGKTQDAARYRQLRRGQKFSVIDGVGNDLRADELDAAVDAAIVAMETKHAAE